MNSTMGPERDYQIIISPKAINQIKQQLQKRGTPTASLRLGVKGGGCSGFSYHIQFEDLNPQDRDLVFIIDNLQVIVDKKSIIYLDGLTLDWEQNLMQKGFKFINPNESSKCSCGLSFNVK